MAGVWATYHEDTMFFFISLLGSGFVLFMGNRHRLVDVIAFAPVLIYPVTIIWVLIAFSSLPEGVAADHYSALCFSGAYLVLTLACFARLYRLLGIKETSSGEISSNIIDCFYFSIITWSTVGYGDFIPASRTSRALAAYEATIGYFTMAAIFAALITAFSVH